MLASVKVFENPDATFSLAAGESGGMGGAEGMVELIQLSIVSEVQFSIEIITSLLVFKKRRLEELAAS